MKKLKKYFKGFTLVELIIVITILAILGTIGFVSFHWYTRDARDANRLSNIQSIQKWFEIFQVKSWSYPQPDEKIDIEASWSIFSYQWKVWENVSRIINMNNTPKDPIDETKYIYSTSKNKKKYQLLAYMEWDEYISFFQQTYADDLTERYPKTFWNNIWIILKEDNSNLSWTWFDILKESNFKIIQNNWDMNEIIISEPWLKIDSQYPWCPEKDIAIPTPNGIKILSACNIWATSTDINSENSWWYTYHWWNNYGFSLSGSITVSAYDATYNWDVFQFWPQNPFERNIYVRTSNNLWLEQHPHSWFKLDNWLPNQLWWANSNNKQDKKWPCPDWYYIPTDTDWKDIISSNLFNSQGLIIKNESQDFFASILKLPYTKRRTHNWAVSDIYRWYYHTSSPLSWRKWKEWDFESWYWWKADSVTLSHNKDLAMTNVWYWHIISYSASIRCFRIN